MHTKHLHFARIIGNWTLVLGLVAMLLLSSVTPAFAAVGGTITSISVGAQGTSLTYGAGGTASFTVNVTSNGTLSNVVLTIAGLPSGATAAFSPAKLAFKGAQTKPSTLTITVSGATPAGARPFNVGYTVQGKAGTTVGTGTLTVDKLLLSIGGQLVSDKPYDGTQNATFNPACSVSIVTNCYSLSGVVGSDDVHLVFGTADFVSWDAGVQDVSVAGLGLGGASANNYSVSPSMTVSANISKASLTVTSNNSFMLEGETPVFTVSYGGFVAGEDASVIDAAPTCDTEASNYSLGTHTISCSGGSDNNYSFNFVNTGVLTVSSTNEPPTDIFLSNQTIGQNVPSGTQVGQLTTDDADSSLGETYSYSLVSAGGFDCTGNSGFQIPSYNSSGPVPLQTNGALQTGDYHICVQTDDHHLAGTFVKAFTITVTASTDTFISRAAEDGWIRESSEFSNKGGTLNKTGMLLVGDDAARRQYKSVLSFDTSNLPDNAVISQVAVKVKQNKIVGGSKLFTSLGGLQIDIKEPFYGLIGLQLGDFAAKPTATTGMNKAALPVASTPDSGGWYTININPTAFQFVSLTGTTQFRLHFAKDDNNNSIANYLSLFSGNAVDVASRPQLIITYSIP